uniref:TNRC6 PABC binding domain-containing protein n=1 Tax=Myotis myotis TaxID=51298 RepID=A0A7J7YF07_MYOMY|nr:hypothetical protein mMyoMyo1_011038 [Myotis myotis]
MGDSYGRYDLIQNSESPASPLVAVLRSWSRAKSDSDPISNGFSINWPPEFHHRVLWKGLQNIDPKNDPEVTPGSVPTEPTINSTIQDVNRYFLKSRGSSPPSCQSATLPSSSAWPLSASGYSRSFRSIAPASSVAAKLSDRKSTWSSGPASHTQAALSHELWKHPHVRKVLGNFTPQISGSPLLMRCLQHRRLITFHLNLAQGNAVVPYSSKEGAAKAQKSLHMCVLGNTTILAEFADEEVNHFLAQGQVLLPTSSWQSAAGPTGKGWGPRAAPTA